jgi:hypothetical protein
MHTHVYIDLYSCATHARGCVSVRRPCIPTCPCARADGTALRFVCASAVPSPRSRGLTHTDGSVFIQYIHRSCPVRRSSYARIAEADMRRVRAEASVHTRALMCVRGRARIRANACEHLTPPPSVAVSARRRSAWRRPSTRTSARGTPPPSRQCSRYAPLSARRAHRGGLRSAGRRRMRGRCARRHRRCVCANACARACSYVYKGVCGRIADGHTPVLECHRAPSTSRLINVQRTHA